jgi:hypothetical protein
MEEEDWHLLIGGWALSHLLGGSWLVASEKERGREEREREGGGEREGRERGGEAFHTSDSFLFRLIPIQFKLIPIPHISDSFS